MTIFLTIALVYMLLMAVYGCFNWSAGGRAMFLIGTANAALYAFILLQGHASGAQYVFLAVAAIVMFVGLRNVNRAAWGGQRLYLMLGGAVILVLLSMFLFPDVSRGVKIAVSVLLGALTISFLGLGLTHTYRSIRAAMKA